MPKRDRACDGHVCDVKRVRCEEAQEEQEDSCGICLDALQTNNNVHHLELCGHAFHTPCLESWTSTSMTCPYCRQAVIDARFQPLQLENALKPSTPVPQYSMEALEQSFDVSDFLAQNTTVSLNRTGDLIGPLFMHIQLPTIHW